MLYISRHSGEPPKWAVNLIDEVMQDYPGIEIPKLKWRVRHWGKYSTGYWEKHSNTIKVNAGKFRQRYVLLHELAHHITRADHSAKFWIEAFKLFAKYPLATMTYQDWLAMCYQESCISKVKVNAKWYAPEAFRQAYRRAIASEKNHYCCLSTFYSEIACNQIEELWGNYFLDLRRMFSDA